MIVTLYDPLYDSFALDQDEMVKSYNETAAADGDEPLDALEAGEGGEEEDAEDDAAVDE